jgi:RNA polymerase sigma-70 factor (ECF subfamily)
LSGVIAGIEACIPALRRYAAALLRDEQEVDDLVHDCLVRALDYRRTWRQDTNLRAWLFAILHNQFISRLRRQKVRGHVEPLDSLPDGAVAEHPRQDQHLESRDLIRALDALPVEQRTVLLLVALEDLSYAEVAQITGVPVGTVMSRLARAREKLRQVLGNGSRPKPVLRRVM